MQNCRGCGRQISSSAQNNLCPKCTQANNSMGEVVKAAKRLRLSEPQVRSQGSGFAGAAPSSSQRTTPKPSSAPKHSSTRDASDSLGSEFFSEEPENPSRHVRAPKPLPSKATGGTDKPKDKSKIQASADDHPHKCNTCGLGFRDKLKLKEHEKVHLTKNIQCPQCPQKFRDKALLNQHVRHIHLGVKRYQCGYCDESFRNLPDRIEHEKTHGENPTFICSFCQAPFTRRDALTRHINRTHAGAGPSGK